MLFHTYLHTAMVNTIRTLITKSQKLNPPTESLDDVESVFSTMPMQSTEILEALTYPIDFTSDVEFNDFLQECALYELEKAFITLRLEGLTMEEITEDLGEPAYRIRQTVREKLLVGALNEEKNSTRGDVSETRVDNDAGRV